MSEGGIEAATEARAASGTDGFRFWTEEKLRNMDTDQFGHVNNSAMASFFEAGRMEIFRAPAVRPLMAGVSIAVVRLLIEFHRELFYPGTVRIGSTVKRVGKTSFEVAQALFGEGRIASAEATCVLIDQSTRRPHPVPDELRAYLLAAPRPAAASGRQAHGC